ncbi:hypothetical protein BH18ACT4_BH18ACT4_15780 [soil metagenome]
MAPDSNAEGDADAADEARLAVYAGQLADAVTGVVAARVVRAVETVLVEQRRPFDDAVRAAAVQAGERARVEGGESVRALLSSDIDDHRATPLSLVRGAVRYPTEVLRSAGAVPRRRDPFVERALPDDAYDLSPAAFADVDPSLHEPGLVWGAAKAHVHLRRRRREA